MPTYLSISFLESPKNASDLFNLLRNMVTGPMLNHAVKNVVFVGSELIKHLATSAPSQFLVLYLNLLTVRGAKITDRMLQKITDRVFYCRVYFSLIFFLSIVLYNFFFNLIFVTNLPACSLVFGQLLSIFFKTFCEQFFLSIKSTYLQNSLSRCTNFNYDFRKGLKTLTGKVFLNIQYLFLFFLYLEQLSAEQLNNC